MKQSIYDFGHLKNYLTNKNYVLKKRKNFVVIEKKDFTSEEKKGNIFYEENGIYLEINGVKHLGYLSMKNYDKLRSLLSMNTLSTEPAVRFVVRTMTSPSLD